MKISSFISLLFLINIGWTQYDCEQSIALLSGESDAPILELNTNQPSDSLIEKGNGGFRIKLKHGNKNIKLLLNSVQTKKNDDQIHCGINYQKSIHLNVHNKILFNNRIITIDSLKDKLGAYYKSFGSSGTNDPKRLDQLKFVVKWQVGCSKAILEKILKTICLAYMDAVQDFESVTICELSKKEIQILKEKYPLNILFARTAVPTKLDEIKVNEDID